MEEKTVMTYEIQRQFDELKLEHEYQLRLKDMNFNEKLKTVTETYSKEIEALKSATSGLRTEKEKEDVKHQEQIQNIKIKFIEELHELDVKNNYILMSEYEKLNVQVGKSTILQDRWKKQVLEFEAATLKTLAELQVAAEVKVEKKSLELHKLTDDLQDQAADYQEMTRQNQEDIDSEIDMISTRSEKKLKEERDEAARLKGENGIMRKKFNTLNKDIEDNRVEIQRMKENTKKHEGVIIVL